MNRIGPLIILEGPNHSKVPFSRSIYLNCSERVLFDTGADPKTLLTIDREFGVKLILNTHYHPDHTLHNHLFPDAVKKINPVEYRTSRTIEGVAKANGVYQEWGNEGVKRLIGSLPQEWIKNLEGISGTYDYEREYKFGGEKVVFLHTPGHTSGFTCPYFPDHGAVFAGDYDMTSFGPWYNGTDGSIEDFISSGERLLTLDANHYITGHQKGIFTKQEFKMAMRKYLNIIDLREEAIEKYVRQGMTFGELTNIGIFYPKEKLNNPILKTWERSGIRKHLKRLGITVNQADHELEYVK